MVALTRDDEGRVRARLLDVVPGRSGTAYAAWLQAAPAGFAPAIEQLRGVSNGGTEAINLIIEKTRRLAHGFRNFSNYRNRIPLAAGGHKP